MREREREIGGGREVGRIEGGGAEERWVELKFGGWDRHTCMYVCNCEIMKSDHKTTKFNFLAIIFCLCMLLIVLSYSGWTVAFTCTNVVLISHTRFHS